MLTAVTVISVILGCVGEWMRSCPAGCGGRNGGSAATAAAAAAAQQLLKQEHCCRLPPPWLPCSALESTDNSSVPTRPWEYRLHIVCELTCRGCETFGRDTSEAAFIYCGPSTIHTRSTTSSTFEVFGMSRLSTLPPFTGWMWN